MNYLDLLPKLAAGTATTAELDAFNNWLSTISTEQFREVLAQYEAQLATQQQAGPHNEVLLQSVLLQLKQETPQKPGLVISLRNRIKYAAAAVVVTGAAAFFLFSNRERSENDQPFAENTEQVKQDIPPGTEGALLTLADGRTILLDSLQPGTINGQGNKMELKHGELSYAQWQPAEGSTTLYNTMQTPRGRQFQLTLPDGTRVWLNAMSSIRFPVSFPGNTREVTITGEAYLEIAKDARKQFIVHCNGVQTEVLGTSFNVNAYEDEDALRITLLEGKIKLSEGPQTVLLSPGTQASRSSNGFSVADCNTDQAIAWKNGVFNFTKLPLQAAMRQIARWYDVDVVYENKIPDIIFEGKIQRNLSLKQILKGLADDQVHFRIEGRRLFVSQ